MPTWGLMLQVTPVWLIPETEAGTPEVEESRGDHVRATDGDVGRLHGLRVDRSQV